MMTCEAGLQKHITYARDEHVAKLKDDYARRKEEKLEAEASVEFLDYNQIEEYLSGFYKAGNSNDRLYYRFKIVEIAKVYGEYLDEYTMNRIRPVLRAR